MNSRRFIRSPRRRAQLPAMPVIGFLDPRSLGTMDDLLRAFRQGLKDTGYVEGENVTIVYTSASHLHICAEVQIAPRLRVTSDVFPIPGSFATPVAPPVTHFSSASAISASPLLSILIKGSVERCNDCWV
jgi:hypothetical protein